jgi:hypothetical protein
MVNHYIHVTERAADYKIMIIVMKLFTTGPNRTYQTGLLKNQPEELSLKPWGLAQNILQSYHLPSDGRPNDYTWYFSN